MDVSPEEIDSRARDAWRNTIWGHESPINAG